MSDDKDARIAAIRARDEEEGTIVSSQDGPCAETDRRWLLAQLDEAQALLRAVEWAGYDEEGDPKCPVCRQLKLSDDEPAPHAPDCRLAKLLEGAT